MKKRALSVLIFVMALTMLSKPLLYAYEDEMPRMGGGRGMMNGNKMDGENMMGMHMMMKLMMEKSVVATSDGGIVVARGNKITKYDKDLNVVKEVEVKMDMAAMGQNMKEMMEQCPMMKAPMMGEEEAAT